MNQFSDTINMCVCIAKGLYTTAISTDCNGYIYDSTYFKGIHPKHKLSVLGFDGKILCSRNLILFYAMKNLYLMIADYEGLKQKSQLNTDSNINVQ